MTLPLQKKALLSLAVTVGTLGTAELCLRLTGFKFTPKEVPLVIWNPEEDKQLDSLDNLHKADPHCLWAPRPHAAIPWSPEENVNAHTYRGPLIQEAAASAPFRIAFLGDSSTFGWGIDFEKTYAARCAASLEKSGVPCEPLNAGVIGYTIAQGLNRYRQLVRAYRPDVVVIAFGAVNDHYAGPSRESDRKKLEKLEALSNWRGRLGSWCRENLRITHFVDSIRFDQSGGIQALRKKYKDSRNREFASLAEVGQVDYAGVRRVSLEEYRSCLEELVTEIEADGARAILLSMPRKLASEREAPVLIEYSNATEAEATRLKIPLVDVRAHLRSYGEVYEKGLFLDHWHPRPKGHELIAEDLSRLLSSIAAERGHPK